MNWTPEFEAKFRALQADINKNVEAYEALLLQMPEPLNPATPDGQEALLTPEQSSGAVPFVGSIYGDEE